MHILTYMLPHDTCLTPEQCMHAAAPPALIQLYGWAHRQHAASNQPTSPDGESTGQVRYNITLYTRIDVGIRLFSSPSSYFVGRGKVMFFPLNGTHPRWERRRVPCPTGGSATPARVSGLSRQPCWTAVERRAAGRVERRAAGRCNKAGLFLGKK